MLSINSCQLPADALLKRYVLTGNYTDCYQTEVSGRITHANFVNAFYTSWLFKLERMILALTVSRASTDVQVTQLASAEINEFAAWQVEDRADDQLLLCDYTGRTRSWLMVAVEETETKMTTLLRFGSAVTSIPVLTFGNFMPWLGFTLLIRFHKIYSVLLLLSAKRKLMN